MLRKTNKYEIFEMHSLNRPLKDKPYLLESMSKHGFMESSPLQVIQNGSGKLKVIRGHHRLHYAKRLGIPVWYVIDNSNTDIHSLERDSGQSWSGLDFAQSHERAGDKDYVLLMGFKRAHGLPMGAAASLVGGESAGSCNKVKAIKDGTFRAGDMSHANAVVEITDYCRDLGVEFATQTSFVEAVSAVLRVKEFDPDVFMHRLKLHHGMLTRRGTKKEYLDEIEALYNYHSKQNRMPVRFLAEQVGRDRKATFGRGN